MFAKRKKELDQKISPNSACGDRNSPLFKAECEIAYPMTKHEHHLQETERRTELSRMDIPQPHL